MSIKLENIDAIVRKIEGLADDSKIESALGKACAIVEASAKQKAPKGDGDLRRSITSKVEDDKGIVYTPLEYAPYVEFGTGLFAESGGRTDVPWVYKDEEGHWHTTSGMKPQPYMRPALNENRNKIIEIVKEGITE
jgi:HK97 gp10 family phage protein